MIIPKKLKLTLLIGALMALISGGLFFIGKTMNQISYSGSLSLSLKGDVPYDLEPDGTAVHRFGLGGKWTITCREGDVVDWKVSGPVDENIDLMQKICRNIQNQQTGNSGPVSEGPSSP